MTTETEKVQIKTANQYQASRAASGAMSRHSGDEVAQALEGLLLSEVMDLATEMCDEDMHTKYAHLNDGMQRMNAGNRIRGAISKINRANDKAKAKGEEAGLSGEAIFAQFAQPYFEARDQRMEEAAKAEADKAEVEEVLEEADEQS